MPDIKLLKEPGFIYDLDFIFHLRFNLKNYLKSLEERLDRSESTDYFTSLLESFGDISDDLYVFFHVIDNGRTFFPEYYISPYREKFATTFNFNFLFNELSDHDRLVKNLLRFYFYSLSEDEIELCFNSKERIFQKLKDSNYSAEEKLKLYEFFIEPSPYIQTLQLSLMEKKAILDQYYEKNYQKIIDTYNEISFDCIKEQVQGLDALDFLKKDKQEFYISFCLLNKYCLIFIPLDSGVAYILGLDYQTTLNFLRNSHTTPNLQRFGQAIGDENRAKILQLLLERKEITRKDLERLFSFSGTTAYHHITMMTNAGVIKTRNEGKLIVYSLNREYFDSIINALQQYSTKEV